ncbi:MAG: VTT domain-containing protein [Deltaproteobacteria bacterium]|nr:VTT domain-containing protein [Deltaproteobacteria bacterium]
MHGLALYLTTLLAALGESTAFVGLFVPGVGAVVAAGFWAVRSGDSIWLVGALASAGAIVGFGLSYHAGRVGGPRISAWSRRAEGALARARRFFERHGSVSVFWGHFFGPVRAFVAFAAGVANLSPRSFWVPASLGGVVWGYALTFAGAAASGGLTLAEAELGRGSLILAGLVVLLYLSLRLASALLALGFRLVPRASSAFSAVLDRLERWSRASGSARPLPELASWVRRRLSADHATGLLLTAGAAACLSLAVVFFLLVERLFFREPVLRVDEHVFHVLQLLRTPGADRLLASLGRLGSGPVLAAVALFGGMALVRCRRRFEAALLLLGFGVGEGLTWLIKQVLGPLRQVGPGSHESFPSNHAFSSLALYGFLAYVAGRSLSPRARGHLYASAGVLFVALGASRVYFGTQGFSDVAGGYALGGTWLAALVTATEAHRRFGPVPPPVPAGRAFPAGLAAALLIAGAWYATPAVESPRTPATAGEERAVGLAAAPDVAAEAARISSLPVQRLLGEPVGTFALVLVCPESDLLAAATAGRWQEPEPLSPSSFLTRLTPDFLGAAAPSSDPAAPVYPLFWLGRPPELVLTRASPDTGRWTARLWRTGLAAAEGDVWGAWIAWEPPSRLLLGVPLPPRGDLPSVEGIDSLAGALLASGRFSRSSADRPLLLVRRGRR